jgi:hypothetical protein
MSLVKVRMPPDGVETTIESSQLATMGPMLGKVRVAATVPDPFTGVPTEVWLRGTGFMTQELVETGDGVVGIVDATIDSELDGLIEDTIDAMLADDSDAAAVFDAAAASLLESRNRFAVELFTSELDRRLEHLGVSREELT